MINHIKAQLMMAERKFKAAPDEHWNSTASRLYKAQEEKRELEAYIQVLKMELVNRSKKKNTCGDEYYFQQQESPGSIQYGLIPELNNVDLNQYRKDKTSFWKIYKY